MFQGGNHPKQGKERMTEVQNEKDKNLLLCPDAQVQIMESNIDTFADPLPDLAGLMKKSHAESSRESAGNHHQPGLCLTQGSDNLRSYCWKPVHGSNRCQDNPN